MTARNIDRSSHDFRFPDMRGFSPRNLNYMRALAAAWPEREVVQRTAAQIPWLSDLALLRKFEFSPRGVARVELGLHRGKIFHQLRDSAKYVREVRPRSGPHLSARLADVAPEVNRRRHRVLEAGSVLTVIAPRHLRYRSHLNPGTLSDGVARTGRAGPLTRNLHLARSLQRARCEIVSSSTRDEPIVIFSIGSWEKRVAGIERVLQLIVSLSNGQRPICACSAASARAQVFHSSGTISIRQRNEEERATASPSFISRNAISVSQSPTYCCPLLQPRPTRC